MPCLFTIMLASGVASASLPSSSFAAHTSAPYTVETDTSQEDGFTGLATLERRMRGVHGAGDVGIYRLSDEPPQVFTAPYTLNAGTTNELRQADTSTLERRINIAHSIYGVATVGLIGGAATAGIGVTVGIIGIIVAVTEGDSTMMDVGFTAALIGGGVAVVSVPVFTAASWTASAVLRNHGIKVSRVPGWIMLGGLSVGGVGVAVDSGSTMGLGVAVLLGGSIAQVITTRRAFNKYKHQQDEAATQVRLLPQWTPGVGGGVNLVVAF